MILPYKVITGLKDSKIRYGGQRVALGAPASIASHGRHGQKRS